MSDDAVDRAREWLARVPPGTTQPYTVATGTAVVRDLLAEVESLRAERERLRRGICADCAALETEEE